MKLNNNTIQFQESNREYGRYKDIYYRDNIVVKKTMHVALDDNDDFCYEINDRCDWYSRKTGELLIENKDYYFVPIELVSCWKLYATKYDRERKKRNGETIKYDGTFTLPELLELVASSSHRSFKAYARKPKQCDKSTEDNEEYESNRG